MTTQSKQRVARLSIFGTAWLEYVQTHWRYRAESKRDLRLDFLRGFCICVMVIDHIGGLSPLRAITGNSNFFISAAEGFVFISGLLLGEVYHKLMDRHGFRVTVLKAFQRAWKLYILTFVLTLGLGYASWLIGSPWVTNEEIQSPLRFALRVLTLRRSYMFTDILVMYTLLIIGAPLALWLLRREGTWYVLAGSWVLWLAYQITPYAASQPLPTIRAFHPAAWQIYFVHAMVIGYHRRRLAQWLRALPHGKIMVGLAALFAGLLLIYLTRGFLLAPLVNGDAWSIVSAWTLKNEVRIGRIITALIVFPFAYLLVSYCWAPLRQMFGWLLLPLGQHSLYSYIIHLPLILLFLFVFSFSPGHTLSEQLLNMAIQLAAVFTIWMLIKRRFLFTVIPQ